VDLLSGFLLFLYMSTLADVYKEDCSFFGYTSSEIIEEREPIDIKINLFAKKEDE